MCNFLSPSQYRYQSQREPPLSYRYFSTYTYVYAIEYMLEYTNRMIKMSCYKKKIYIYINHMILIQ